MTRSFVDRLTTFGPSHEWAPPSYAAEIGVPEKTFFGVFQGGHESPND